MKKKLRNKNILFGTWLTLYNNNLTEIIASTNFDWLAIDLEHSSLSFKEAEDMIRIIELYGTFPLVRLPSISSDTIKKVMDIGVKGLIIPNVNSVEDIIQTIKYAHYPKKGIRGVGLARANRHGTNFNKYYNWQKKEVAIIAQIENKSALDTIDEIFSSKLIDAYFIGPYDLSASMGIPGDFNNIIFKKAINIIKSKANKYNIAHGIHVIEPDIQEIKNKIKEKFTFIACSLDSIIIKNKCEEINRIKK